MLFDFGKPSLISRRVAYTSRTGDFPDVAIPAFVSDCELSTTLTNIARHGLRDIGLGYRPTTWNGLMSAALLAEQIPFVMNPTVNVSNIGIASLNCFVIDNKAAISVSALGQEVTAMDRACLQTCLRWLNLPWGICFHFGKANADMKFVSAPKGS